MEVTILEEHGYTNAIKGFGYSYMDGALDPDKYFTEERFARVEKAALANAGRGKGHDKWLRQVNLWMTVKAPRYWWSEFDTYKISVTAQSTSTMHTLSKRYMGSGDIQSENDFTLSQVDIFNQAKMNDDNDIQFLKGLVPESYLQRRLVTMNYAVLRCIIDQRKNHALPEWRQFIESIYEQVERKELLQEYPY